MPLDNLANTKEQLKHFFKLNKLNVSKNLLTLPTILHTVKELEKKFAVTDHSPSIVEIEKIYFRFAQAIENKELTSISNREWRMSPYIFWYQNGESKPLGSNYDFISQYINWLKRNSTPGNWRKLIHVFLRDYNQRSNYKLIFQQISCVIREELDSCSKKNNLIRWTERDRQINLFSRDFCLNKAIDSFIQDANCDWDEFAILSGLHGDLGQTGYAESIGKELLNKINTLPSEELLNATINYYFNNGQIRFNDHRVKLIEALLSPWATNAYKISSELKKRVHDILIENFKDPRIIAHQRNGWRSVNQSSLQIMLRWLVGDSIEQFFDIVDQMALDHQWKYRKAFWMAYFARGYLDEAWFALGPDAQYYAETHFGNKLSFGKIVKECSSNQSVLIIKIKDLVFAEWSHNGKCRAWLTTDPSCPSHYKDNYSGSNLKAKSLKIVPHYQTDGIQHQGSENYSWQEKLNDFIYQHTGIKVYHYDFRI
ncbi:TPA: hypothetical protein I8Y95_000312 [Legionella pneumophila]|uniref:Zorya protein ZorC EH domain-containing protein n=1 Tax=Legionella pneumophila (strain Lens) TaxID=297245 RepID=Q5WXM6_LEGPL|nr:EH signature domain-containing protein [Legionella pneumophila]AOW52318.1 hypothetical protein BE841_07520 [Legionella pneumophila subsp. pneumophila]AOW54090.1 hypothetical protein BE842_01240 [Legionella pneumophila subsp. pneumophila]AOW63115.1 hypothetical protein BE845_03090 [Legionella pneumophila subsp. pneumophila]RYW84671.1 hypothetical protein D7221_14590 [Legionella pneumophila]CAH15306.1 hypothetical protein lpl1069 [Legionella pneumophila str. Lens]